MGCGKSSVGRALSQRLPSYTLIDTDAYIEKAQGRTIPEIFKAEGETAFRKMELSALSEIMGLGEGKDLILSLGGGTLTTPECATVVKDHTFCVYLRGSVETLTAILEEDSGKRPMLKGSSVRARVERLLREREATYEATADVVIDIENRSYDEIALSIVESLNDILPLLDVLHTKL